MTTYYSVDDDIFFPDKKSVFDVLYGNNSFVLGAVYYSADVSPVTTEDFSYDPDFITEHFDVMLSDIVGEEYLDTFLKVSEEARLELQQMLTTWIDNHIDLPFMRDSKQHHVTSKDIAEYARN